MGLFGNDNKKKLRSIVEKIIDDVEKDDIFAPSCKHIILGELEKIMKNDFQIDGVSFQHGGDKFNFTNAAYTLSYFIAFDKLRTGQFCLMGDLVNTMEGPNLMKVVVKTSDWAVENGLMDSNKRNNNISWLRNELRNLG